MIGTRLGVCALLLVAPLSFATAEPITRPGGGGCDSTKTGVTVTGTQDGKAVTCTADACYWTEFLDNPPRHINHTSYSNVRDCKPAARVQKGGTFDGLKNRPLLKSP
jgi:hypothetical protein